MLATYGIVNNELNNVETLINWVIELEGSLFLMIFQLLVRIQLRVLFNKKFQNYLVISI